MTRRGWLAAAAVFLWTGYAGRGGALGWRWHEMKQVTEGHRVYCISWKVAGLHSGGYRESVARLLLGTCAQESNFEHRRQSCFARMDRFVLAGGFGLWQLEPGSVHDSIRLAGSSARIERYVTGTLDGCAEAVSAWKTRDEGVVCEAMMSPAGDVLSCLLARLHYLRFPASVPMSVIGQARYWKQYYNTPAGKGTEAQYVANWRRLCEPIVV